MCYDLNEYDPFELIVLDEWETWVYSEPMDENDWEEWLDFGDKPYID